MKNVLKKIMLLFTVFSFFMTGIEVFAAEKEINFGTISLTKRDGEQITNGVDIWQELKFSVPFSIPNNTVSPGDTTTIKMNKELTFANEVPIEIKKEGKTIATVKLVKATNEIIMTYTDEVANFTDISGHFFFLVRVENAIVLGAQDIEVTLDSNNKNIFKGPIHYNGPPAATARDLEKVGWKTGGENKRLLDYRIDLNQKNIFIENATVVDRFDDNQKLTISDIYIYQGTWVDANNGTFKLDPVTDVTAQFKDKIIMDADNKGFKINLGNIDPSQGYRIRYKATTDYDPINGEKIINNLKVENTNQVNIAPVQSVLTYNVGGSGIVGYQYQVKIVKKDEQNQPLQGAEFKLIRNSTGIEIGKFETNAAGEVVFDKLLKDNYTIIETKSPVGYILNPTPIAVSATDFNDQKIALKEITNKKIDEKVNVIVKKSWLKNEMNSATIKLFADNVDTGQTLTLDKASMWEGQFSNLFKYDQTDGHEIVYTVDEVPIPGYKYLIVNTQANEFIITNYEMITIKVKKEWIGNKAASATFRLFSNGIDTGETITLNEAGNWQGQFPEREKYDLANHQEYQYTIKEENLNGYTSLIKGDAATGFVATNISNEKINIPVTKKWVGSMKDSVDIKLYADNVDTGEVLNLNAGVSWTGMFANKFKYDQTDGHEIKYTIEEVSLPGYKAVITGDASGFTVTNTKISSPIFNLIKPKENDPPASIYVVPKTGADANVMFYLISGLSSLSLLSVMMFKKRKI